MKTVQLTKRSTLGSRHCALRKDPTFSSDTNTESHQLEPQLGANILKWIWWVIGHPFRLAFCPSVSSPSSGLPLPHYLDC
eukprot:scaffold14808_cov15-Tisochrysis_lutea.AAC.1